MCMNTGHSAASLPACSKKAVRRSCSARWSRACSSAAGRRSATAGLRCSSAAARCSRGPSALFGGGRL
ncbi:MULTISPECIES: hypothetical protein [unclassified Streptomyces]|uniref:hypothetical protein n=1 Tax=unclassified Streptomyces TaxID=2593676 RepID=UPI002E20480D